MTDVLADQGPALATLFQLQYKLQDQSATLDEIRGLLREMVQLLAAGLTVPDIPPPVINYDGAPSLNAADIAAALGPLVTRPQDMGGAMDRINKSMEEIGAFLKKGPQIVRVGGGGGSQIQIYDASSGVSTPARVLTSAPPTDAAGLVVRVASLPASLSLADARGLTERMFAKAPQAGYHLWSDLSDASYIYFAEAPDSSSPAAAVFQGIRLSQTNGSVATAQNFVWNNRATAGWAA